MIYHNSLKGNTMHYHYEIDIYDKKGGGGKIIKRLAHEPKIPIEVNTKIKVYDIITDIEHLVHVDKIYEGTAVSPSKENPLETNWAGILVKAHFV